MCLSGFHHPTPSPALGYPFPNPQWLPPAGVGCCLRARRAVVADFGGSV